MRRMVRSVRGNEEDFSVRFRARRGQRELRNSSTSSGCYNKVSAYTTTQGTPRLTAFKHPSNPPTRLSTNSNPNTRPTTQPLNSITSPSLSLPPIGVNKFPIPPITAPPGTRVSRHRSANKSYASARAGENPPPPPSA